MKENASPESMLQPSITALPFQKRGDGAPIELLSEDERRALSKVSRFRAFPARTIIYNKGSAAPYVFNIVSGAVETYDLSESGTRRVSAFLFAHDLLGLSENGEYVATAETLIDTLAYEVPIEALTDILDRDPKLDVSIMLKLCHDLREAQRHSLRVSSKSASRRLAGFLLWLYEAHVLATAGAVLTLPMNRQDIADYLGLSGEAVSRAMQVIERGGAITRSGPRTISIIDEGKLAALAAE
jgi:CRP-like cAMP-binding protein